MTVCNACICIHYVRMYLCICLYEYKCLNIVCLHVLCVLQTYPCLLVCVDVFYTHACVFKCVCLFYKYVFQCVCVFYKCVSECFIWMQVCVRVQECSCCNQLLLSLRPLPRLLWLLYTRRGCTPQSKVEDDQSGVHLIIHYHSGMGWWCQ